MTLCPACAFTGRRGYCAPRRCYCGHSTCHAAGWWRPLPSIEAALEALTKPRHSLEWLAERDGRKL